MSFRVLQINFKFSAPGEEMKKGFAQVVNDIAAVTGLRWKINIGCWNPTAMPVTFKS